MARLRRAKKRAFVALPFLFWMGCGQVYRPVVIPCSGGVSISGCPVQSPPTPANFHAVFGITANVPGYPGGAMQIDVGGDSIIAETATSDKSAPNLGNVPTYAAVIPNKSRLFVASAGSVQSGGPDVITSVFPAFVSSTDTGFGPVTTINLPSQASVITAISEAGNVVTATLSTPLSAAAGSSIAITGTVIPGCLPPSCDPNAYNGTFTVTANGGATIQFASTVTGLAAGAGGTASVPPQPVFLNTTENANLYVANFNSNSVSVINTTLNNVSNSAAVGANPVSLAETTTAPTKLYTANQGGNSVSSLNTIDLSANTVTGFTGVSPVWVVARADSQKVYVLDQGDGQLVTINVANDTVVCAAAPAPCSPSVGAGANFLLYDPHLNRLYVTNPVTSMVYVFSDTGGANDTPVQLAAISFAAGSTVCPSGCSPSAIAALGDGSRFYVASYQVAASCPDPLAGTTGACVIPTLAVFNAGSFTLKTSLTLLTYPPFLADLNTNQYQYAVPAVTACAPPVFPVLYAPGANRFRVFTAASIDSTRIYVSLCDAGAIAVVNTTDNSINSTGSGGTPPDTLVTDLPAAFSGGPLQSNGLPANQNPIFLLPGQ